MNSLKIKKNDTVVILSGKDKGKKGKVLGTVPSERKVVVEGCNMVTCHIKPRRQGEEGGIMKREAAIYASKVQVVCPKCNKGTRVAMEIKGDKTNEDMTAFRLSAANMSPPQAKKAAQEYINKHPKSIVSLYLIKKYFINTAEPDYVMAYTLAQSMVKADKNNARASMLVRQLKELQNVKKGGRLPSFSAVDIDGKAVSGAKLNGKLNVIISWAGWNYESVNIQRELRKQKKTFGDKLQVIGICLDADTVHCRRTIRIDSLQWQTICDQQLWESPTLRQLAITTVPGNIVADSKGKIIAINLTKEKLRETIEKQLK